MLIVWGLSRQPGKMDGVRHLWLPRDGPLKTKRGGLKAELQKSHWTDLLRPHVE